MNRLHLLIFFFAVGIVVGAAWHRCFNPPAIQDDAPEPGLEPSELPTTQQDNAKRTTANDLCRVIRCAGRGIRRFLCHSGLHACLATIIAATLFFGSFYTFEHWHRDWLDLTYTLLTSQRLAQLALGVLFGWFASLWMRRALSVDP